MTSLESLGIDRMSVEERLELIWDSIAAQPRPELSPEIRAELDRRAADHAANPQDVVSWDDAKASALDRLQK